jgi:uncharacterized membrane-anchored protein YhcB (DUF1043 family)
MGFIIGMLVGVVIGAGGMTLVYRNNKKVFEETLEKAEKKYDELKKKAD